MIKVVFPDDGAPVMTHQFVAVMVPPDGLQFEDEGSMQKKGALFRTVVN